MFKGKRELQGCLTKKSYKEEIRKRKSEKLEEEERAGLIRGGEGRIDKRRRGQD